MAKNQSSKYSKEFLDKTIKVWQPYCPTPLSLNDAREITENMTALFNFLIDNDGKSKGIENIILFKIILVPLIKLKMGGKLDKL